jgi:hypothetical protein
MAGPAKQITGVARETSSIRGSLLACTAVCLIALWIAAFEMPFADVAEAVLLPFFLLAALAFVACCLWSVFLLGRVRRNGARSAVPFVICALTMAALTFVPFTQVWLQGNFRWQLSNRERIVARVEAGELTPNVAYNPNLIELGDSEPAVSVRGNDIVVDRTSEGCYVLFLTSRGFRHYFSGFLHVPPGGDPAKFFEFDDKPPSQQVRYGKDWYFVAN